MDSRVGAQLNARFSPQVSAIVQVTSEQRYDGTYRPEVEWANIKYDVTPDFSIRAGRTVLPSFMVSDYRKVGYATPWVRPPVEVYSLMPLTCVFRGKLDTDSTANRSLIPRQTGHPVQRKLDSNSAPNWIV